MSMTIFFISTKVLTIVILRRHYWSTVFKQSSLTPPSRSSVPSSSVPPPSHCFQGAEKQAVFFWCCRHFLSFSKKHCNAPPGRIIAAHPDNARIKSLIGKIISNFSLHEPMHQVKQPDQNVILPKITHFSCRQSSSLAGSGSSPLGSNIQTCW